MKCLLLVLLLIIEKSKSESIIEIQSSNDLEDMKRVAYISYKYRNKYPLESFLRYNDIRNDIKNLIDLQVPELHCNIKDICTFSKTDAENQSEFQWFCELYYYFEHKSKFVFLVNNFDSWFVNRQNIIIHSDQVFSNNGNIFFNRR